MILGLTHVAVATAASVSNTSWRMLHSGSDVRYGCVNVWLAIQWPSFTARATTLEYPATCCPITKNEALTFFSARMSSNRAVLRPQSGTGTCTHNKQRYYRWQARYNPPRNTMVRAPPVWPRLEQKQHRWWADVRCSRSVVKSQRERVRVSALVNKTKGLAWPAVLRTRGACFATVAVTTLCQSYRGHSGKRRQQQLPLHGGPTL